MKASHFATDGADPSQGQVALEDDPLERLFSGEEGYGRYLDLHYVFDLYVNLKGVRKLNYLQYLDQFDKFSAIPKENKNSDYKKYLQALREYLESYFQRAKPLTNLHGIQRMVRDEFEEKWAKGEAPGWARDENEAQDALYCVACRKQYTKQTVYDAHLNSKKHLKAAENLMKSQQGENGVNGDGGELARRKATLEREQREKEIAALEALLVKYAEVLGEQIEATKANVERKQALTDRERNLEQARGEGDLEVEEFDPDQEDEDDRIYNPLKLPLGWDGKPIPYWLYKLHGLGVEYSCEICGNYVYRGRKAFDMHFQEARHVNGMRCLGIPNWRQFHDITSIDDAYALWEKLKSSGKTNDFQDELEEEYEDSEGNVFNKKTYEDLKRQGLL
ncbi:uncharacterized protein VTP21DRAFT_10197 [Calcarisporiella thermophila]|uniref:uncharacterized protein n=1 Tax=Calcarisporiella thermophila TaxID=911321 RepID=UPI0037445442